MARTRIWAARFLLCASLSLLGADWWRDIDGFDFDSHYPADRLPKQESLDEGISALLLAVSDMAVSELVHRCRLVVEANRESGSSQGLLYREALDRNERARRAWQDWLICGAAIRRMGASGDHQWVPILEELYPQWQDVATSRSTRMQPMWVPLAHETLAAYQQIVYAGKTDAEILELWRHHMLVRSQADMGTLRNGAIITSFRDILHNGPWPPEAVALFDDPEGRIRGQLLELTSYYAEAQQEVFDAAVGLFNDPLPSLRSWARLRFVSDQYPERMVPALIRFLNRDDLDDDAIQAATDALHARGYMPVSGPEGVEAHPIPGAISQPRPRPVDPRP